MQNDGWVQITLTDGSRYLTPFGTFENWWKSPLPVKLQNRMDLYVVTGTGSGTLTVNEFDGWINFAAVVAARPITDKVEICQSTNTGAANAEQSKKHSRT